MAYLQARWVLGKSGLPWLQPGENLLFSSGELWYYRIFWYYRHRLPPWPFAAGGPFPTISITFHVTDRRAVIVVRHCRLFQFELSHWRSGARTPQAAEFIHSVTIKEADFGNAFLEFSGLTGPLGLLRWPFTKIARRVRFLEILSGRPGTSRARIVQIYFGLDTDADAKLEAAYQALAGT